MAFQPLKEEGPCFLSFAPAKSDGYQPCPHVIFFILFNGLFRIHTFLFRCFLYHCRCKSAVFHHAIGMRKSRELNVPICKGDTTASTLFHNEPCCRLCVFKGSFGQGIYKAVCYGNALPADCPVDKVLFGMHHVYQVDDALRCHAADRHFDLCFRFFRLCFLCLFCHVILEKHPSHLVFHAVIFKYDLCVPVHRDASNAVCKGWRSKVF